MENNDNLKAEVLNDSLNKLLNLFDEGQSVLKGDILPSTPPVKSTYDFSKIVETILDPNKKIEDLSQNKVALNNQKSNQNNAPNNVAPLSSDIHNRASAFDELRRRVNNNKAKNTTTAERNNVIRETPKSVQSALFESPKADDGGDIKYFTTDYSPSYFDKNVNIHTNFNTDDNDISHLSYSQLKYLSKSCQNCRASKIRANTIFGEGPLDARLLVIGEGPGEYEDRENKIFVGPSGQYLEKWLKGINLDMRKDVYLTNIVKCYSKGNPTSDMVNSCKGYLKREIQLVAPTAILVLGKVAANGLLENELSLATLREKNIYYNGIPTIVTYHPAAVLRNQKMWRRPAWEDVKKVARLLNITLPSVSRSK